MSNPNRKFKTLSQDVEEALAEAEPAAQWIGEHPPGARLPYSMEPADAGSTMVVDALQFVRDAFSALEFNIEVTQTLEESGGEYFVCSVVDEEGNELFSLTVEDRRDLSNS